MGCTYTKSESAFGRIHLKLNKGSPIQALCLESLKKHLLQIAHDHVNPLLLNVEMSCVFKAVTPPCPIFKMPLRTQFHENWNDLF